VRRAATPVLLAAAALSFAAAARAHGDPASDYLLGQSVFLPLSAKIDQDVVDRLRAVISGADRSQFKIKVAVIAAPSDLGTAASLYRKPQRYAEFLGLELSFAYRDRLLVVMPNGFGYAVGGDREPGADAVLKSVSQPGRDATKQVNAATVAVRRLAAAAGHPIVLPKGGSETRDRIVIAAAATSAIALIAAFVLFRRGRPKQSD
jgi:hypothetical protein